MPFDLSPWGFVRPAIHCNVVISKFISQKSFAPSIPELSFLFLFQGKRRREGRRESEALVGVKVLACATGATTRPRSRSRASRGSRGLPGPAGRALGTGSEGFFPLGQWRVAGSQPHSLRARCRTCLSSGRSRERPAEAQARERGEGRL